jgi:hypothetical protein
MKLVAPLNRLFQTLTTRIACPSPQPAGDLWKRLLRLVWVGLGSLVLVLMALLIWRSRETLLEVLRTARYEYFAWTFVAYAVSIGAVALGWHLVMHHLGQQRDWFLNVKIYVYTLAARRVPGTLWYIAGRAVLYKRLGIPGRFSALASAVEVLLSIVSGLMVGAPALFLQMKSSLVPITIFVSIELIGLGLLYPRVLCGLLARFGYHIEPGRLTVPKVLSWLGAYAAMWVSGGLMACSVISALYPLDLSQVPWTISLWALTGAISFAAFLLPHNLGISEITLSILLSRVVPLPIAMTTAILIRILTTIFDIMWSSLFLLEKNEAISAR